MAKNAVATVETKANVPAYVDDFASFAGEGLENVTAKDILIPRLGILQDLSPQVKKTKAEYIDGAEIGMICDIGTGELMPNPVIFLPVYYCKQYLEWAPRSTGKGLVAIHNTDDILRECKLDEKNRPFHGQNLVQETAQFYGLNLTANGRRSFIPMASTQLKRGRKWLTLATSEKLSRPDRSTFTPPLFFRTYSLSTVLESNNDGEWYSWKVDRHLPLPEIEGFQNLLEEAKLFRDQLVAGEAKGDVASMQEESGAGGGRSSRDLENEAM
jgi:hypothetical protein